MLFMASCLDEESPVISVLENKWYTTAEFVNPTNDLHRFLTRGKAGMEEGEYARYWHGYLSVLMPLLTVVDYETIRIINYIAFFALTAYLIYLIKRRFSSSVMLAFLISLLYASAFFIPQSIQYSSTFYIALVGSILAIKCPWQRWGLRALSCMFVALGAATSYVDFLVTPVVTLGFPLIFIILEMNDTTKSRQRTTVFLMTCAWFFGYVGMWAGKWILCAAFTDCEVASIVGSKLAERSIGQFVLNIRQVCARTFWFLPDIGKLWWACIVSSMCGIIGLILWRTYALNNNAFKHHSTLLLLMFIPLAWLMLAYNHTLVHTAFTHRIWSISIFALLVFIDKVRRSLK